MKSFFERLVARLHGELSDRGTPFLVGESELSVQTSGARVVWVWRGGRLSPATRGPFSPTDPPGLVVRPLYQNEARVEAYLSAPTAGELETVWTDVLTATRRLFGSNSVPLEYDRAGEAAVSRRADAVWMMQAFTWSLFISEVGAKQAESTVFGGRTVVVLGFDTSDLLAETLE